MNLNTEFDYFSFVFFILGKLSANTLVIEPITKLSVSVSITFDIFVLINNLSRSVFHFIKNN